MILKLLENIQPLKIKNYISLNLSLIIVTDKL